MISRPCKKIIAATLTAVLVFSSVTVHYCAEEIERTVTVFHTNDMHGSLIGSDSVIGIDKVSALKKETEGSILVDAGDATQGVALATLSKGEDVIELMNSAGYDVMAAGNHEFDNGTEHLSKLVSMASFPIISANTYLNGRPLFENENSNGSNVIIERNGIKVGIFALTTSNTATSTNPKGIVGVEFKNEIETAKEQTALLDEEGADVVIAITHMGIDNNESDITSYELAQAMADTELDAIIDGHSHSVVNEKIGNITIAQTGTGLVDLGRMDITVDEQGNTDIVETMLTAEDTKNAAADETVTAKIDEISSKQKEMLSEVIGETEGTLWGGAINQIAEARVGETNLGSLISDSILYSVKDILPEEYKALPVVAVENGGGFRTSVPNGKITREHIVNTLPFANTVMYKVITPNVLYAVLEGGVSSVNSQDKDTGFMNAAYSGSFLQIGGMRFEYDPNGETGNKVKAIYIDGQTEMLDRNDTSSNIVLGSNDYVIGSGALENIPISGEGSGLNEAVTSYIAHITENGTKPISMPVTTGRIKTVGDYVPKDYTAHVRIKNADGSTAAEGTNTDVYVDGTKTEGIIGADGVLDIPVSDGPHSIKLYPEQAEIYVNNYSGAGVIESFGTWNGGYPVLQLAKTEASETTTQSTEATTQSTEATTQSTEATTQSTEATTQSTEATTQSGGTSSNGKRDYGGHIYDRPDAVKSETSSETTTEEKEESPIRSEVRVSAGKSEISVEDDVYDIDAAAYIQPISQSMLVPLRFVSVAIAGKNVNKADKSSLVEWDANTKTAYIYAGENIISFTAGSDIMKIGNRSIKMSNGVKAEIKNERMYIPFRALGEALDVDVKWNAETKTAIYALM